MGENVKRHRRKKKNRESSLFYRFTMIVMSLFIATLVYLINEKQRFVTMQTIASLQLSDITSFLMQPLMKTEDKVASQVSYQLVKDHLYSSDGNEVVAILDGVIIKSEAHELIQLCDNEVSVTYKNVEKVQAKQDERVLKGTTIGMMQGQIEMHFYFNNKEITMKEALSK